MNLISLYPEGQNLARKLIIRTIYGKIFSYKGFTDPEFMRIYIRNTNSGEVKELEFIYG